MIEEKEQRGLWAGRCGAEFARADMAEAELSRLRAENEKMREALELLVAKLDLVHTDERYKSVWAIAQIHTAPYAGPTYTEELIRARASLSNTSEGGKGE